MVMFSFHVLGESTTVSELLAVRVQDVDRQIWYEWNSGAWTMGSGQLPKCKNGGRLYIAAWFVNKGSAGTLTATIKTVTVNYVETEIGRASATVATEQGIGVEANMVMPSSGDVTIKVECKP